jgi:aryl-alcohol dehydrogenase-like predicted oxidoreductase
MKYHSLGKSDLLVSEVGFGAMSLELDSSDNQKLIHEAVEFGINFIDTADLYDNGDNESLLGEILKPIRQDIYIATKVGNQWKADGSGWEWKPTKEHILSAIDKSLKRLNTDYIDLYQLHGGTLDDPFDEIIEAFERLKEQGKIRTYGISSIRPNVIKKWIDHSNMDSVMVQYSLLDRRPEEWVLNALSKAGISAITRGSLAKGLLIDKEPKEYLEHTKDDVRRVQKELNSNDNTIQQSIHFALDADAVSSAILGLRTRQQLQAIKQAYSSAHQTDIEGMKQLTKAYTYRKHRI